MSAMIVEPPRLPAIHRKFWVILGLSVLLHASLFVLTS